MIRSRSVPSGSPHGNRGGWARAFDRLMLHGLEYLNLYYGVYRAQVVDNEDDENVGRITIRCPAVGDTDDTTPRVAFPIFPLAGSNHGIKFIPPTGTYCYVVFENGRVDVPLWIGGWFARDDIPSDLQSVDQHWILTPGGHLLHFDDRDDSAQVQLKHSSGAEFVIDKDGNVNITNVQGKVTTVGSSAQGDEKSTNGETLVDLFDQTLTAIIALTVTTSTGPSGTPINFAQFQAIKAQLQTALSNTVKIAK